MPDIKYYVYVSDTKLDMLFAQIPVPLRKRIAADVSVDLQVVSVSLRQNPSEETRYSKAAFVSEYIDTHLDPGSVDEPRSFFRGTLPMRWGPYGRSGLVFFTGSTATTRIGLGGSMQHVLGGPGGSAAEPLSGAPGLMSALKEELGEVLAPDDPWPLEEAALYEVSAAIEQMTGPSQRVEFLAKKLLVGYWHGIREQILLGSPIYVALED